MSYSVLKPDKNLRNINIIRLIKWSKGIQCPYCHSKNVKKLEDIRYEYHYNHVCLDCGGDFHIVTDIPDEVKFKKGKVYTKKEAMEIFRKIRWGNKKPFCPICYSDDTHKKGHQDEIWRYYCKKCKENFSDTTDTIFYKRKNIEKVFFILSNMDFESIAFWEIAEKIGFSNINHVKEIVEEFEDFFESEKKTNNKCSSYIWFLFRG